MHFNLKDYLKISFLYTFAASFPALLQIFVLPLIEGEGKLNAIDFSQMAIAESITTLVGTFILFSMTGAISRFFYDYLDDATGLNKLFSSIIVGILFRGLILIGLAMLVGDYLVSFFSQSQLHDFSSYGYGSIVIGINRAIIVSAATLYRNQKLVSRFIWVNILLAIVRTVGQLVGIFYFDMSFVGYVNGAAIGGGLISLGVVAYTFKTCGIQFVPTLMRPVLFFAFPLFFFELVKWGVMFADRMFLESSPEQLGIYDNAQRFAAGIYIIFQGLYGAVQPDFFRYLKLGVETTISDLRRLTNIYLLQAQLAALGLVIPVIAYIYLFFETTLATSGTLVAIIFSQYIITALNTIFSMPIIFFKRTDIFLYINLAVLTVSLTINYFLIPLYGYYGAIVASYTANLGQLALFVYFQNRIIKIKWNYNKTILVPLLIVACAIMAEFLKIGLGLNYMIVAMGYVLVSMAIIGILYRNETKHFIVKYLKLKI
jgi:O-antigen/teichoic acid export membrane protein